MTKTPSIFSIRNIQLFIAFRVFFNARFYYPVFTILFLDYGLTIEQFALLNSVWAITIVIAEVPSGALADVLGRKRLLVATALFMVVEMVVIAFVPLANITIVFWAFLINRVLSGLAEAMASGADEAIAYDTLAAKGLEKNWPKVLSLQMRLKSIAAIVTASTGALFYDPDVVNTLFRWLDIDSVVTQQQTMRYPVYLTLILALLATWASLLFKEDQHQTLSQNNTGFFTKIYQALVLTLKAGGWILQTPFALAIIMFGMYYDHVMRMIVTMTSQYFRLIALPEASFGFISAAFSLLGLVIPKLCEKLVAQQTPQTNMFILFGVAMTGLTTLTFFVPYLGLLPMAFIWIGIMMVSFFSSHYLNRITDSAKRATVLSFKGMAFNLAYGAIGVFFAVLMQYQRAIHKSQHPQLVTSSLEDLSFVSAVGWFPWYSLILFILTLLYFRFKLRNNAEQREKG